MTGQNFDRACYGWKCVDADNCRHKRDQAETKAQFYYRMGAFDPCPFYDPKDPAWGEGAEPRE